MDFKKALITGATSGIGEALAYLLAEKGIKLILSGRNQEKLEKIAREVNAERIIVADLDDKNQRESLVSAIRKEMPELLINNAGFGIYGDALSISVAEQLKLVEVNAMAPLELTLEAVRAWLREGKKGVVMNISSVAGEFPCPGMAVYGGTKAFLSSISQALNTELFSKGVYVLVNCPGMVATDFARRAAKKEIQISNGPVLTPEFVAKQIWKQIEKRQEKRIINWQYRISLWLAKHFAPLSLIKKITWNQIKKRI